MAQDTEIRRLVSVGMQKEYYLHARIKGISFFSKWKKKKKEM